MTPDENTLPNRITRSVYLALQLHPWPTNYWQRAAIDELRNAKPHPVLSRREIAQSALSQRIWPEVRKAAPRSENWMYSELLEVALSEVDWYEVAILLMDQAVREEGGPAA